MSWLDDKFPGHNVNLLVGDVLNLSAIRRARNLAPWDLIVDRQSGPLAQLSGENTGADAIKLLRIYAENLTEGGRLVVTKNFNMQEPNPQVESFLASSGSPFERVTETSSGDKTASVVYKKKPAC
jgi:hypothetical protein